MDLRNLLQKRKFYEIYNPSMKCTWKSNMNIKENLDSNNDKNKDKDFFMNYSFNSRNTISKLNSEISDLKQKIVLLTLLNISLVIGHLIN